MSNDLDALFRRYREELHLLAYRRLADRDAAADVVQDAFVRYAGMSRHPNPGIIDNPRHFLWRIVINLVTDLRRRNLRQGHHVGLDEVADRHADPRPTPDQMLESRRQLKKLRSALNELPDNCRRALLLNRLDGLTHAEIGERLGVSASMVSKYIMRALRHCAKRLASADR